MNVTGAAVLAFLLASLFTAAETATSGAYARSAVFLFRCWTFWARAGIYGAIAAGGLVGLQWLETHNLIAFEGPILGNLIGKAVVVGISTKALLHIRLFNVQIGNQGFPVGLETFVQVFDPWLQREMELCHFNATRSFIDPRVPAADDLEKVKNKILNNIPPNFSQEEVKLIKADLDPIETRERALEVCLFYLGRGTLKRVFPRQ